MANRIRQRVPEVRLCPPSDNEIQLIVFGPSYGESILLHVGDGRWIVVDSCNIISGKEVPAPLWYFDRIGANVGECVELIVATHWHDDHIRGISRIVEAASGSSFACSSALCRKEFLTLVALYEKGAMMESTGVTELGAVLSILRSRSHKGRSVSPVFCCEGRKIAAFDNGLTIHASSPSDSAVLKALVALASLMPNGRGPKRRLVAKQPNHLAVALRINWGDQSIILGSDLEDVNDLSDGWHRIVAVESGNSLGSLIKVAHHGSVGAYNPHVWSKLLQNDALAIVTPFYRGGVKLPTREGCRILAGHTRNAYIAGRPDLPRVKARNRLVSEMVRDATTQPMVALAAAPSFIRLT